MSRLLAEKLRVLRARAGWTINKAAKESDIAPETLSALERNKRRANRPTLRRLAKAYEVDVDELIAARDSKDDAPDPKGPDQPPKKKALKHVRNLSEIALGAVEEAAREGQYEDLLALAEKLDKASGGLRETLQDLSQAGALRGFEEESLTYLDDLDSAVSHAYTEAIRVLTGKKGEVVRHLDELRERKDAVEERITSAESA